MNRHQDSHSALAGQVSPLYEFTIRQRAGLHILEHAIQYASAMQLDSVDPNPFPDASRLMWEARERILKSAERSEGVEAVARSGPGASHQGVQKTSASAA